MSICADNFRTEVNEVIDRAFKAAIADGALPDAALPDYLVERPGDSAHGELATNAALAGAKGFRMAPVKIASILAESMDLSGTLIEKIEVAGPGFINFYAAPEYFTGVLTDIIDRGADYGKSDYGNGQKVLVEFVSANPTGPIHMGNSRVVSLGDCLASVLVAAGFYVEREFYVNDAGNQIEKFGLSLDVRYKQHFLGADAVSLPEDAYQGGDITDLAEEFAAEQGDSYLNKTESDRRAALARFALPRNIDRMKRDLELYRITYDTWYYESELHQSGAVNRAVDLLKQRGMTYEKDGAVWYKATAMGAEKDEVLVRANGVPTYFAADIAYHADKFARGFDICIDIWGADHHGHVARMKGAMDAIGLRGSRLDIVLMQLVRLTKDGEVVRMSKRTGKAITLVDLLEEIPIDAVRFLFNLRDPASQMEFDLGLAVEQSSQNPVYYCQYAHARICSIFKKLEAEGITLRTCPPDKLALLRAPEERELIRHLSALTEEIIGAAKQYDPARITRYVMELATLFHKFYNACRVNCGDEALTQARLSLCAAVRGAIKNILTMFKIETPENM